MSCCCQIRTWIILSDHLAPRTGRAGRYPDPGGTAVYAPHGTKISRFSFSALGMQYDLSCVLTEIVLSERIIWIR